MAKQYHRRQSGLIVADDSIAIPKPDLPRPWYAGRISANRGMSRRKCCCKPKCNSHCNAPSETEIAVDFGDGGWTNGICGVGEKDCLHVSGIFVLTRNNDGIACHDTAVDCCYYYQDAYWCGGTGGASSGLRIWLGIRDGDASSQWRYRLYINMTGGCYIGSYAMYYSEQYSNGGNCIDPFDDDGYLTLTKSSEFVGYCCNGSLASSITLILPA